MSTATRTKLAVIGDPIAHSLSPALHQFLIDYFHLPFSYESRRVLPEALPSVFAELRRGYRGVNVTIPHKQVILPLLDELSENAHATGAVNTVVFDEAVAYGENTDVAGFLQMMHLGGISLRGREVLVLGAGGAARAVIFALQQAGVSRIFVCNRSAPRLSDCESWMAAAIGVKYEIWLWHQLHERLLERRPEIIINATSAGMHPNVDESPLASRMLSPEATVVDLVYNPLPTKLLREARQAGARTVHGLNMLIVQGVASMEYWCGNHLEVEPALPAVQKTLLSKLASHV